MDVVTRENGIIAGSIVVAIIGWFAVEELTSLGTPAALAVLIAIGILLPTVILNYLP